MTTPSLPRVLVLGGGPDPEREVSINSATGIADALRASGRYAVDLRIIGTLSLEELRALPADVIFPYLHGPYGEGGPLQDLLEADGRPYVGSGARASRAAMDKISTKAVALRLGIPTPEFFILNPRDAVSPLPLPVVVKPVHEGSTIGLHVCESPTRFHKAVEIINDEIKRGLCRAYMIEPKIGGGSDATPPGRARELTVGVIDATPLPIIEITPAAGLYDYQAKYVRNDTTYTLDPALPSGVADRIKGQAVALAQALGCRHISRVDFMLDAAGVAWLLEINTTPGFTDHSLVPKAARHAGIATPDLCARLVEMARRDHA